MTPGRLGVAAVLVVFVVAVAACQPGAVAPGVTPPPDSTTAQPDPSFPAEVFFLDGTITYTADGHNGSADSFTESHKTMTLVVHLVGPGDGGPGFKDAGSTFNFIETTKSHDAQRTGNCGLDTESSGTGGGPFVTPGQLVGYYSYFNGTTGLGVHAQYKDEGKLTFLCNSQTSTSTTDEIENTSCGDPAGGLLMGKVKGNIVDFTCSETYVIGTGGVVVKGSLTSR